MAKMNSGTGADFTGNEAVVMLLAVGVVLCSLLCVIVSLRNGGAALQKPILMLICQFYLLLTAMLQLASSPDAILPQVIGFVVFALGVAPIVMKKTSFQGARYCIALGATLAACAIFLF